MDRRVSRIVGLSCVLALGAAQGCSMMPFQKRKPPEVFGTLPPAKARELVRDDRERLGGIDSPLHQSKTYLGVDTSGEGGVAAAFHVMFAAPYRAFRFLAKGETPLKAVAAMEDASSPDNRRQGILKIMQNRFARREPYTKRYAQIATEPGTNPAVRAAALRALNYSRSRFDTDAFSSALDDADPAVRLEAAKALANVPDDKAVTKLVQHLQNEDNKDVRIASADALRSFKTAEVARALIGVLNERDFGVAWQARESLRLMTGHDFRYDDGAWIAYLASAKNPFM